MRILKPAEIQKARERLGMSQDQFAATFHLSPSTLRKWEQGQRDPSGAALVLLWLLTKIPDEILRVMKPKP
jgi:putative transcriptional regulator